MVLCRWCGSGELLASLWIPLLVAVIRLKPNTVHLCPFSPDTAEPQSYRWLTQYRWATEAQAERGSVRTEVKRRKIHNTETLQIKQIWSTANGVNLIADTIRITASVMEHASLMAAPFAWLENHQTLQHYYDVCVSWERGTESNSTEVISHGGLRCLAAYTLSVT